MYPFSNILYNYKRFQQRHFCEIKISFLQTCQCSHLPNENQSLLLSILDYEVI